MADDLELQSELARTLAGQRNRLDPEPERPSGLFGSWVRDNLGSASQMDRRFEWAKNNPQLVQDDFGNSRLGLLLASLGLRGASSIMRDSIMANRLSRLPSERPGPSSAEIWAKHNNEALLEGAPQEFSGAPAMELWNSLPTRLGQKAANTNKP